MSNASTSTDPRALVAAKNPADHPMSFTTATLLGVVHEASVLAVLTIGNQHNPMRQQSGTHCHFLNKQQQQPQQNLTKCWLVPLRLLTRNQNSNQCSQHCCQSFSEFQQWQYLNSVFDIPGESCTRHSAFNLH
jgi:hypothetical protein